MPNVTSAPSRKKDKRKSLVVTTETVSSEILSPMTPALDSGESNLENVNKNPYIEVLNKKVKKLKKTMTRIEKYENIKDNPDGTSLNNDQIKLLERKGETSGAIKEIDEALKQMEIVEKEEFKKQAEQKRAQQMERDQAIANAVEEAKAAHCKSLLRIIQFFRLIHFQQREIIKLSEIESEAVETLRAKLTTLAEEAKNEELYDEKVREVLDHVNKLQLGDESLVTNLLLNGVHESNEIASSDESSSANGVTYSQLLSLIQSPPILESSEEPQIEQDEIQETFEIVSAPNQLDDSTNVTIPTGGLQFMYHPDVQSQPQSTVNDTYGYQSNDVEQVPASAGDVMLEVYQQQHQNYDTSTVEQQYIEQQQHFVAEQNDQQVSTEHEESSQQEGKEQQIISEDQTDSKQPQTTQQDSDQPPPVSQASGGHRGSGHRPYRGNRGFRGSRRDSGGYRDSNYRDGGYRDNRDGGGYRDNYAGGYRDGGYRDRDGFNRDGNFRGARGGSGSRGGRGGGFQGNRGAQYRQQRSQ